MASYTWKDSKEYTSGTTSEFIESWDLNNIYTNYISENIPRYSKISKVTFSIDAKQNLSLSKGSIGAYFSYYEDDVAGDDVFVCLPDKNNSVTNSYQNFSNEVTSFFVLEGSACGRAQGFQPYGILRYLCVTAHATVIRKHSFKNISLKFDYNDQYTISTSVSPSNSGTVSGGGTKTAGTTITLTANPATGYEFKQWSDGNTQNPRPDTVTGNITYTAEFVKKSYTISASGANGTVTGGGIYEYGTTVTLTATPNSGYKFVKWSDENTSNPRTITVSGNATYTAIFEKPTYTITFKNHDGTTLQTISVEHGGTPKYTGSTPTKSSTAEYSYSFSGWSPSIGAITSDTIYIAQFTATKRKYTISASVINGTVDGVGTYEYGTSVILTVNPDNGYKFEKWSDDNTQNPRTITVTGNATYEAQIRRLILKFKSVKIYYPTEVNVASPDNPLITDEKAQIVVQIALE